MPTEILTIIVSVTIYLIGELALAAYALRSRSKERDSLWIGLDTGFAIWNQSRAAFTQDSQDRFLNRLHSGS
jgi:hypothetical protein